jgi:anti-sigma regulatory factor (Ser/Thr protein kinase)
MRLSMPQRPRSDRAPRVRPWDRMTLVALPTAVRCARAFATITLRAWGVSHVLDDALVVTSELVTNAVHAMALAGEPERGDIKAEHVIGVQFRIRDDSLYVEVWDNSASQPIAKPLGASATSGRGLRLVERLTNRWGTYWPPTGGKIVWAELHLSSEPAPEPPLPYGVPGNLRVPEGPVKELVDTALMRRVSEGLRKL